MSAIDWLSDVVREPPQVTAPQENISSNALPTTIITSTLDAPDIDAVGIFPAAKAGLPADFWGPASTQTITKLISELRTDLPRPVLEFLQEVMLSELKPPIDSGGAGDLFLARIDWFLGIGALEQAEALLERADPKDDPRLFSRWFNIALLTGSEEGPCRHMLRSPDLAPTYPARIFCLARAGDWDAAALTLNTGRVLDLISAQEDALLARFLDPELFEGAPFLPVPERITPLNFRMHEAIGEALSLGGLPNAFAFAALSENEGWKARIAAAERLARATAIPPDRLAVAYTERSAAASGGVWDRVDAWQDLQDALAASDVDEIATAFPNLLRAARRAGLEPVFAEVLGAQLLSAPLAETVSGMATEFGLLSKDYEAIAANATDPLLKAIATGNPPPDNPQTALRSAISAAFTNTEPPQDFAELLAKREFGTAFLKAAALLEDGARSDPASIETALSVFRALSLTDLSRRTALYLLLSGRPV